MSEMNFDEIHEQRIAAIDEADQKQFMLDGDPADAARVRVLAMRQTVEVNTGEELPE